MDPLFLCLMKLDNNSQVLANTHFCSHSSQKLLVVSDPCHLSISTELPATGSLGPATAQRAARPPGPQGRVQGRG